jgi:hypothetical protein
MKNIITIIAGSLLLLGCGKQQPQQHMSDISFPAGSTHDATVKHLQQVHAKILKDSPELVSAEFNICQRAVKTGQSRANENQPL